LCKKLWSESRYNLIEIYEAQNKPEKAEEWRAKLLQTEAVEERYVVSGAIQMFRL
jgi:hypothetical protein